MPRSRKYSDEEKARRAATRHRFTEDQQSRGGAQARWLERHQGIRLNHGMHFGKREREREREAPSK